MVTGNKGRVTIEHKSIWFGTKGWVKENGLMMWTNHNDFK